MREAPVSTLHRPSFSIPRPAVRKLFSQRNTGADSEVTAVRCNAAPRGTRKQPPSPREAQDHGDPWPKKGRTKTGWHDPVLIRRRTDSVFSRRPCSRGLRGPGGSPFRRLRDREEEPFPGPAMRPGSSIRRHCASLPGGFTLGPAQAGGRAERPGRRFGQEPPLGAHQVSDGARGQGNLKDPPIPRKGILPDCPKPR